LRPCLFFPFFLLPHLAPHLALKLVESHHLIRGQDAAHLRAYARLQPDLISLRGGEFFGRLPHRCFVIWLAHYRAVERLTSLSQPPACRDSFIFMTATNLLHALMLLCRQPYCLHQATLKLSLPRLIWIRLAA
jgi:hypothetical protein